MRSAALAALLLAAEAFLQPRRPGPTTALAARKRSQRGKEKGSADHSSVDDWTGRHPRTARTWGHTILYGKQYYLKNTGQPKILDAKNIRKYKKIQEKSKKYMKI